MEDVFELQDKVALSVAGVIEPALQEAEIRRSAARPTSDLTAFDLYLRARPLMRGWGKEPALQGLDLLREAIARDPNCGPALVGAAWCTSQLITGGWVEDPETDRREALDLVRRAVKAAADDPEVLVWAAGTLDLVGEDIGRSLAMLDHALTLNPSNAFGWFWSGFLRLFAGSTETAIEPTSRPLLAVGASTSPTRATQPRPGSAAGSSAAPADSARCCRRTGGRLSPKVRLEEGTLDGDQGNRRSLPGKGRWSAARSTREPKWLTFWLKARSKNCRVHRVLETVANVGGALIFDIHVELADV
jgi:hypothetical protein